ncbi:MAG: hypothetical protein JJU05_04720 [Verrucomicrobia bacterium]|nr:hypothetical protein [Verrucomicrobiota bacterium]MCH8526850.1 hypothetical protein [Kiritimatiellia bacterium]
MSPPPPKFALAMADDYPWEDILVNQLAGLDVEIWPDCLDWDEAELTRRLRGVDAVVTGRKSPRIPDALIQEPGCLRAVLHCHGGVRQLVRKEHLLSGITVTNWGTQIGGGVAEGALALMLACLKQLRSLHDWAESGKEEDPRIYQNYRCTLFGAKIGIYGYGPIGRRMAMLLEPFSPQLAVYDPYAVELPAGVKRCETLEELFNHSDMVTLHCGLNDVTRNSVTADLLDRLPQGGILVNTARGAVVDEEALAERVHAGRLLAGVDVVCEEGSAWGKTPLAGTRNAILGAHAISKGKGVEPGLSRPRQLAKFVVENLRALAEDAPLKNVITPEMYDLKT